MSFSSVLGLLGSIAAMIPGEIPFRLPSVSVLLSTFVLLLTFVLVSALVLLPTWLVAGGSGVALSPVL